MKTIFVSILALGLSTTALAQPKGKNSNDALKEMMQQQQEEIRQLKDQVNQLNKQVSELRHEKTPVKQTAHEERKPIEKKSEPTHEKLTQDLADNSGSSIQTQKLAEPSSADLYNEARTLLDQQRFAEAEVALSQFIKRHPKDPMLINAYYWLAETHYIRSDYETAALKFGEAYQMYMDHKKGPFKEAALAKGPEIMFKLSSSLYNLNKFDDAKVVLEELQKEFPKLPANIRQQSDLLRREIARKANPS